MQCKPYGQYVGYCHGTAKTRTKEVHVTDNAQEYGEQPTANEGEAADLMPRFLARLIDGVALWFVMFIVIVPIVFVSILGTSGGNGITGSFGVGSIAISIVWAAIVIGYFAYMESSRGQTLGKMVMKLQTQGPDGQNPSFEVAAKRNAFYAIGIVPIVGGLLSLAATLYIAYTINQSSTHQGWHDEFAGGTKVIKTG